MQVLTVVALELNITFEAENVRITCKITFQRQLKVRGTSGKLWFIIKYLFAYF